MHIQLETLLCWIVILFSLYYIFKFVNRFSTIDTQIKDINKQIRKLNNETKEDILNVDDSRISKSISEKILINSDKKEGFDDDDDTGDDDDDTGDDDDDAGDDDAGDDDVGDDDDTGDDDDDTGDDNEDFTNSTVIEGFNNKNYNDDVKNKLYTSSSTIYSTDFSNIYNNYVKNNLLDITHRRYNNQGKETDLYIKSKCRGWKKKIN